MSAWVDPACGKKVEQRGNRTGHCARCHETFEGLQGFDAHQRINSDGSVACLDPSLVKRRDGSPWFTFSDGVWWDARTTPPSERGARGIAAVHAAPGAITRDRVSDRSFAGVSGE